MHLNTLFPQIKFLKHFLTFISFFNSKSTKNSVQSQGFHRCYEFEDAYIKPCNITVSQLSLPQGRRKHFKKLHFTAQTYTSNDYSA